MRLESWIETDKLLVIKKGNRRGICHAIRQYVKAT